MKLPRRQFLHLAAGIAALPVASRVACAEAYPARPVHMIVGFPAGQAADIIARLVCQPLSDRLGQQFVVDDRPGAGGNIGTEAVVRSAPDGYTLLTCLLTNAINATLYADLNFNFIRDTAPVANMVRSLYVMVINPSVPAQTVAEFIAYAKANPGKINMGSAGIGTPPHIFGELFQMMTGITMVHVPYRGAYVPDLLAGQVQVVFSPIPTSIAQIRAGKLRALGVTSAKRSVALPDTPADRRIRAGLRRVRLVRRQRAKGHARRNHRKTEQGNQRHRHRSGDQDAAGRFGRGADAGNTCAIRQIHRRRYREMGQGGSRRQYQARITQRASRHDVGRNR